jgi:hypothetical protein
VSDDDDPTDVHNPTTPPTLTSEYVG